MYERKEFKRVKRKRMLKKIMREGMEEEMNNKVIRIIWKKNQGRNNRKTQMGGARIMSGIESRFNKKKKNEK